MKREKMSRYSSKKNFRRGNGSHRKNFASAFSAQSFGGPMRGGIRL